MVTGWPDTSLVYALGSNYFVGLLWSTLKFTDLYKIVKRLNQGSYVSRLND